MSQQTQTSPSPPEQATSPDSFVEKSSLYQEFLAEREEILRHKWLESEKQGRDIGFEKALLEWIVKHRAAWRDDRMRRLRAQQLDNADSE